MRIGLLHQYRLATSGSGLYATEVAATLLARGHDVFVFSHDERPEEIGPSVGPESGARSVRTNPSGRCSAYSLREGRLAVAYPRAEEPDGVTFAGLTDAELDHYIEYRAARICTIAKDVGLDVLHANHEVPSSYIALRVHEQMGLPYVVVAHGSTIQYVHNLEPRYRPLTRAGLRGAHGVVALNADVRERLLRIAPDIEPAIVTVPVGVDLARFHPPANGQARVPGQMIGYVGRLSLEKGVHALLAAFVQIGCRQPEAQLLIMGAGVARPLLEHLVHELGHGDIDGAEVALRGAARPGDAAWVEPVLHHWRQVGDDAYRAAASSSNLPNRITFTGALSPDQVASRLREVDVLVVPSLVHEAFPLVTLEALASGVPPVVPSIGGLAAVLDEIDGQLGLLGGMLRVDATPEAFVSSLAAVVGRLTDHLSEPSKRVEARRVCRELAARSYSWDVVVDRLEALYQGAAAGVPTRPGR